MIRPRLQIVRGLPGSGKSTYATSFWPHLFRLEFDFFCHRGGEYAWNEERNSEGQRWLSMLIAQTCISGIDFVVTGVFSGNAENLDQIVKTALVYDYDVYVKTVTGDYGNRHAVRESDLQDMRSSFLPESAIASRYRHFRNVHIGSMPTGYGIAPAV